MYRPDEHYSTLDVIRQEWLLRVTLNRPEVLNAFSETMWRELDGVFEDIENDATIRAVLLRGAGGNFSAGGDVNERQALAALRGDKAGVSARNRLAGTVLRRISTARQVVIAVVEGFVMGGGVGLACTADVVVAREDAVFRMPEATLGIPIAQIVPFVLRKIGPARARRLALTGHRIRGGEAHRIGLVDVLTTAGELEGALEEVLIDVGQCAPNALAASKKLIDAGQSQPIDQLLAHASEVFAQCYLSSEGQEGSAAFGRRGKPAWSVELNG